MREKLSGWWMRRSHKRALGGGGGSGDKMKRRYRFFQIGFFVLLLGYGGMAWFHYDYWVFRVLIAGNYIFTDDLDALYAQHILGENRRSFHRDFDRVMISVFTEAIREVNADRFTYLYTPQAHVAVRAQEQARGRQATIEPLTDTTVYLWVPNISRWSRDFVLDQVDTLAQYENIILDLRYNSGGMLRDFHRIADLFVPRGAVLGHEITRWSLFTRTITASGQRGGPALEYNHIIILQNHRTASAAEGLIQALDYHLLNVTTIGTRTFGKGVGQVTIPLTGGYAVRASVLLVTGPGGEDIHHVGIYPHVPGDAEMDWVQQALALIYE